MTLWVVTIQREFWMITLCGKSCHIWWTGRTNLWRWVSSTAFYFIFQSFEQFLCDHLNQVWLEWKLCIIGILPALVHAYSPSKQVMYKNGNYNFKIRRNVGLIIYNFFQNKSHSCKWLQWHAVRIYVCQSHTTSLQCLWGGNSDQSLND